jgi:hypothetical protein
MVLLISFDFTPNTDDERSKASVCYDEFLRILHSLGPVLELSPTTWLLATSGDFMQVTDALESVGDSMLSEPSPIRFQMLTLAIDKCEASSVSGHVNDERRRHMHEWINQNLHRKKLFSW